METDQTSSTELFSVLKVMWIILVWGGACRDGDVADSAILMSCHMWVIAGFEEACFVVYYAVFSW